MSAAPMFTEWLQATLDPEQVAELAEHGADTGWPGLTYTSECVELYERFAGEIREALNEDAEELGYDSPDALVASFNRRDMLWDDDRGRTCLCGTWRSVWRGSSPTSARRPGHEHQARSHPHLSACPL